MSKIQYPLDVSVLANFDGSLILYKSVETPYLTQVYLQLQVNDVLLLPVKGKYRKLQVLKREMLFDGDFILTGLKLYVVDTVVNE